MARFLKHVPCPKCGSRDNLAEYDDGSAWCFGCGYRVSPDHIKTMRNMVGMVEYGEETPDRKYLSMPDDVEPYYPVAVLDWFKSCGLTSTDMSRLKCLWSDKKQWLIFPFFDGRGDTIAWQARSFNPNEKRKYHSQGDIHNLLHIFEANDDSPLVLVEGILDAYKVFRAGYSAMPLFGSHVSAENARRLYNQGWHTILLWLDKDKQQEAVKYKRTLETAGIETVAVISTVLDPKNSTVEAVLWGW